ncbi:MAG: N-6 DNA methylase [Firmicutes bacterium]|nr:N-6 DNA methylase [Bacillota bacterium]
MLEPYRGRVYDPACGSGGMFVRSRKFIEAATATRTTSPSTGRSATGPPGVSARWTLRSGAFLTKTSC